MEILKGFGGATNGLISLWGYDEKRLSDVILFTVLKSLMSARRRHAIELHRVWRIRM